MTTRSYQIAKAGPGRTDTTIAERATDGTREAFLALVPGTPSETKADVVQALNRAYRAGREDRGEELLPHATGMAAEIREYAREVLREWGEGYETFGDGEQHRIDVEKEGDDALIFEVRPDRYAEPEGRYRLRMTAEKLED